MHKIERSLRIISNLLTCWFPVSGGFAPRQGRIYSQRGLCSEKNVGALHLFFLEKLATFFCWSLSFTRGCRPLFRYFGHAKNSPLLLWGPFLWAPVRPNMLNMPKSAAAPRPPPPQIRVFARYLLSANNWCKTDSVLQQIASSLTLWVLQLSRPTYRTVILLRQSD